MATKEVKVKAFKLKENMRHTQNGVALKPGDVVDLTEAQGMAFADKFDALDGSNYVVRPLTPEVAAQDVPKTNPAPAGVNDPAKAAPAKPPVQFPATDSKTTPAKAGEPIAPASTEEVKQK